jgi:hypothetical protein
VLAEFFSSASRLKLLRALLKLSRPSGIRELEDLTGLRSRAVEQAAVGLEENGALKKLPDGRRKLALDSEILLGLRNVLTSLEKEEQKLRSRSFETSLLEVLQMADIGRKFNADFTR